MEKQAAMWKFVKVSEVLCKGTCELVYAQAVSDGGKIQDDWLYDGEDDTGEEIINLQMGAIGNITLNPPEPIKCNAGLYFKAGSSTEGVLIMWRPLAR